MSKELEEIKTLRGFNRVELNNDENVNKSLDIIEQSLHRLESIDNANPSEALECLEDICKILNEKRIDVKWLFKNDYNTIKQALIKAEKEHNSVNLLMQELDCKDFADLRKYARCGYQTFKNAKGANYDNIIIDEAQEPKQYVDELKLVEKKLKALEILKEKKVSIFQLSCCKNVNEYNELKFKDSEKLTEEEFELLRSVLE